MVLKLALMTILLEQTDLLTRTQWIWETIWSDFGTDQRPVELTVLLRDAAAVVSVSQQTEAYLLYTCSFL